MRTSVALWAVACLLLLGDPQVHAGDDLAERKVVLQITDNTPDKQELVLNVASNLVKHYGAGSVDVEVVAFGPGLPLLLADNAHRDRVQSLEAEGVRFSACENTLKGMTKKLGHRPQLNAAATSVPAGIARLVELSAEGYTIVRP
jgi:hypothetical protein